MTESGPPFRDVLAVTIGPGGVRARRTGRSDAADSFADIPDAPTEPAAAEAAQLVAAVTALVDRAAGPAEAIVWAVPESWSGAADAELLRAIRASAPLARCAVIAHSFATHVGALGGVRPGICLEVADGAATLVTDTDQVWHRVDGWGPLLGGRGSGAWLGAHGLAAGLRFRDGVPDGSAQLLAAGRATYGPEEGWPALFAGFAGAAGAAGVDAAEELTRFAPVVAEVAREDPLARAIVQAAGESLAEALVAGRELLPTAQIVAVGGLLYVEGVRVALAAALGRRKMFLVPGLGGALEGARLVGEHLLVDGRLPHRPPYVVLDMLGELGS